MKRQHIRQFCRTMLRVFQLAWSACPAETVATIGLSIVRMTYWSVILLFTRGVVDTITLAMQEGYSRQAAYDLALYTFGIFIPLTANRLWWPARSTVQALARLKLNNYIQRQILQRVSCTGLSFFDSPEAYDQLEDARREASGHRPLSVVEQAINSLAQAVNIAVLAVALLSFNPLLTLLILVSSMPSFYAAAAVSGQYRDLVRKRTPQTRRMDYIQDILTSNRYAKETRLFGFAPHLQQRWREVFSSYSNALLSLRRSQMWWEIVPKAITHGMGALAHLLIFWFAIDGRITIGQAMMFGGVVGQLGNTLQQLVSAFSSTIDNGLFVDNLFSLVDPDAPEKYDLNKSRVNTPTAQKLSIVATSLQKPDLELRHVTFLYPGTTTPVLRDVSISIPFGQRVALVGLNGAGKTTVVKLLTRMYDPDEGAVLVNGVDVRQIDPAAYRHLFSVCFQEFCNYAFTAAESIGIGDLERLTNAERIRAAAMQADVHNTIESLPQGYDTFLSREFSETGSSLSGGQWQKVALARMFMREAAVYIMDEPTAALDAEAEHRIFQQFMCETSGKTALLITHRLSSVSMVDRILVLDNGRVVEDGSHAQLIAAHGQYARLFHMQAERYRTGASDIDSRPSMEAI